MTSLDDVKAGVGSKARILVVDDQRNMRLTTAMVLRGEGFEVLEASDGNEALALVSAEPVDLMLTDLKMAPVDGLTLLKRALEVRPKMQVIVMTGFGSIETAVEAMRRGAYDYVSKPFKEGEIAHRITQALEHGRLLRTVSLMMDDFTERYGLSALVGESPSMQELTAKMVKVASSDATVLIQGESGTGKELVARAIHGLSQRKAAAFVPVNCAAITESLLESELFGHAKGAFTGALKTRRGLFEEADRGTIFIDEVTETTPIFQSKLLRVLQEGEVRRVGESTSVKVDARTVAATNRDLEVEVQQKRFRQDLYYRLAVVTLRVPPLRERLTDVPMLARHFLSKANLRNGRKRELSESALDALASYDYPGNVRELENLVEQAAALSENDVLVAEDFPLKRRSDVVPPSSGRGTLADTIDEAERVAIVSALEETTDLLRAAEVLGISSTTLWRKMRRLNIRNTKSSAANDEAF
jgi:two-component system, NtrC family, response regulator HydG